MTTTVNSDCSAITLTSDLFNPANISNTLYVSVNEAAEVTVTIPSNALTFTLEPQDLDVEEFAGGVYQLRLVSTAFNSTTAEETTCIALLCNLECDATTLNLYSDTSNISKVLAFEGLKVASGCVSCNCSIMHKLYKHLTDGDTTGCGCCCS